MEASSAASSLAAAKPLDAASSLPSSLLRLYHSFGFPSHSRHNLHYLSSNTIILAVGNTVQIIDLASPATPTIIRSHNNGGVGSVAVHPSRTLFAVGECGVEPLIVVYAYPSLEVVRVLSHGTERSYSDVVFSDSGDKLASVGGAPDYLLTVWDWRAEVIMLHAKAFSQEVYRLQFAPGTEGRLVSAGMGHIRFWEMAKTFTGLKLEGEIGKFGNVDLSDISCFAELPSGRVVSGSESGNLLLWEGNFILFPLARLDGSASHDGNIEFVALEDGCIVSAGRDGRICYWPFEALEFMELAENETEHRMEPRQEVRVVAPGSDVPVEIVHMLRGDDHWLVQDARGRVLRVNLPDMGVEVVLDTHGGAITSLVSSPASLALVSASVDGTVRAWDVLEKRTVACARFQQPALCSAWLNDDFVLVGFAHGVLRVLRRCSDGFVLTHACKPHSRALTSICISPDRKTVATLGDDGTVFFLAPAISGNATTMRPLGFVAVPGDACAVDLCWAPDSSHVLYCTDSDLVLRTDAPGLDQPAEADRDTFELCDVKTLVFQVSRSKSWSSNIPAKYDELSAHDAKKAKAQQADNGNDSDGDDSDLPVHTAPLRVSRVRYMADGRVLFALRGADMLPEHDYLYFARPNVPSASSPLGSLHSPAGLVPLDFVHLGAQVGSPTALDMSPDGEFLLVGTHAGHVQVRPVARLKLSLDTVPHFGGVRGEGSVLSLAMSPDQHLLHTAGNDASLFTFRVNASEAYQAFKRAEDSSGSAGVDLSDELVETALELPEPVPESLIPCAEVGEEAADINDPKAYSIQEDKLQREQDELLAAAERRKADVRGEIAELRAEFEQLVEENLSLDPSEQLPRTAFELDPELREQLEAESAKQVEQVRREMAWISEKRQLELQKLRDYYFRGVLVEHIRLGALRSGSSVHSFRTQELPQFLQQAIDEVHALLDAEEAAKQRVASAKSQRGQSDSPEHLVDSLHLDVMDADDPAAASGGSGGAEQRRRTRQEIVQMRRELEAAKPNPDADDPRDEAAIRDAEENMGDYKLKSDPGYVVPEDKAVNTEKKRREMVLLQESVHFIRMGFNENFLALRDLKKRIIENIRRDNERLRAIAKELGEPEPRLFEPELDASEWPEKRDEYTKDELREFVEQRKAAQGGNKRGGMFGGGAGGAEEDEDEEQVGAAAENSVGAQQQQQRQQQAGTSAGDDLPTWLAASQIQTIASERRPSALEQAEETRRRRLLEHERNTLRASIDQAVRTFDQAVTSLQRERIRLQADLKAADLKLLTLYEELTVLSSFEANEGRILNKVAHARAQKADVVNKMVECEQSLAARLEEIEAWKVKDEQLMKEFNAAVTGGAKNDFYAHLLSIFQKTVKQKKRRRGGGGGGGGGSDGDASGSDGEGDGYSSDEDMSDSSSDEDDEDDDACPVGCDHAVYERVLELREKRLQQEDKMRKFNALVLELKKKYQQLQTRDRSVDRELKAARADLQEFQSEKQKALNEIQVTVPLLLSQFQSLTSQGTLPADLTSHLVFTSTNMQRLHARIGELQEKNANLRDEFKKLKRYEKALSKDLREKEGEIEREREKCREVQMLKFGQVIDLNVLEKVDADETAGRLKQELEAMERENLRKLRRWDVKIQEAKRELAVVTQENTQWLQRVADLTQAQYELENELNNTTANVHVADVGPSERRHAQEKERLVQLIQRQEEEIDALRGEIHLLRRKGGQLYVSN